MKISTHVTMFGFSKPRESPDITLSFEDESANEIEIHITREQATQLINSLHESLVELETRRNL